MSIMARSASAVLATLWAVLPAASSAAQGEPSICSIALDQDSKSALMGVDSRSAGTVVFADPRWPDKKLRADRFYLRVRAPCAELADRREDPDDVPDIVLDVMGASAKKVVAIAFRPRIRDCQAVRALVGSVLGAPQAVSASAAEWALPESRRRVLVTENDGSCWIHQQRTSF
jgi:hypothetical protein